LYNKNVCKSLIGVLFEIVDLGIEVEHDFFIKVLLFLALLVFIHFVKEHCLVLLKLFLIYLLVSDSLTLTAYYGPLLLHEPVADLPDSLMAIGGRQFVD
jgi:hypothetical protein